MDDATDHVQGPAVGPGVVELVEYGDFQCPHCARAATAVQRLMSERPNGVRFAFRHFPLKRMHPLARAAAEASEAADRQGAFWAMHDLLFARAPRFGRDELLSHAAELGLDANRFAADLDDPACGERVQRDIGTAARSGVNGTPTFFVNVRRHNGAYDLDTLRAALDAAG